MFFNLIYNHKIILCIKRDTVEEAGKYIKEQILKNDECEWKNLIGINPSECKIRVDKIVHDYYDLDGNLIKERIIHQI